MGKKVYTINGKMYLIDDDTGKILTIEVNESPLPQKERDEVVAFLAKIAANAKDN